MITDQSDSVNFWVEVSSSQVTQGLCHVESWNYNSRQCISLSSFHFIKITDNGEEVE